MSLPRLAADQGFMAEFLEADPLCFGLGLVEVGGTRCALVALRPERSIPRYAKAGGFALGHSLLGGDSRGAVHFAFEIHGQTTYNALVNPSDPVALAGRKGQGALLGNRINVNEAQAAGAASSVAEARRSAGDAASVIQKSGGQCRQPARDRPGAGQPRRTHGARGQMQATQVGTMLARAAATP